MFFELYELQTIGHVTALTEVEFLRKAAGARDLVRNSLTFTGRVKRALGERGLSFRVEE